MRNLTISLLVALFLAGCSAGPAPRFDPALYPRVHQAFDLTFFWRTDRSPDNLTLSGFVKNRIHYKIRDVEVSAVLLDATGHTLGNEVASFILTDVAMDDYADFSLPFPLAGLPKPEKARIYYRYNLVERESGVLPQHHSFDVPL